MCDTNCDCDNNPRIFIPDKEATNIDDQLSIVGNSPIVVSKAIVGDTVKYTISSTVGEGSNGNDGENGNDGKDGIAATITIGQVSSGDSAQVTNTGTANAATLNFVLPKGTKGEDGKDGIDGKNGTNGTNGIDGTNGITTGIKSYVLANGGSFSTYSPMNNFSQGVYVDLGSTANRRLRVKAWVTVASMRNWITLRLSRSDTPTYNGTLISQRVKHSEATLYVGQHEINAYVETSDRYVGFTFSDTPGGNYNSDGAQYGDYAIEVFVLD